MTLRVTVIRGEGETPASFAARLAAANGLSAREFCLDWDITFQSVVDGDAAAVATIANKGGVPAADLQKHAFVRGENWHYEYRGEQLLRSSLRRKRIDVCPACLKADIAASDLMPQIAVYGRAISQLDVMKTCPIHKRALVTVSDDMTPATIHDFTRLVAPVLHELDRLADESEPRETTGLENYVLDRLEGCRHSPLLDSFDLFIAISFCDLLGAVDLYGRTTNLKRLSDEQWRLAGAQGFAIADGGTTSVREFLGKLQATFPYKRSGREGPQALFGRIYQALEFGSDFAGWDPVRALVGGFIRDRLPLGPEDLVFGEPAGRRVLHSVRTLSADAYLHPKRTRKLLRASGIIDDAQMALPDHNVIFDAQAGSAAVQKAKGSLSLPAAGRYLNAPRVQSALLAKYAFIEPFLPAKAFGAVDQFAVDDLEAFLKRLLDGACPVDKPNQNQVDIPSAASLCCCASIQVLQLILDKKLNWVGRDTGLRNYMSVLVDVEEVRSKVRGADYEGFAVSALSDRMQTNGSVARALVAQGHLATVTVINPVNRCPTVIVPHDEVERFEAEYVSLFGLARERGLHHNAMKKRLEAAGIKPALDTKKIGATFYRRSDCQLVRVSPPRAARTSQTRVKPQSNRTGGAS
jgi:hypothetical protein